MFLHLTARYISVGRRIDFSPRLTFRARSKITSYKIFRPLAISCRFLTVRFKNSRVTRNALLYLNSLKREKLHDWEKSFYVLYIFKQRLISGEIFKSMLGTHVYMLKRAINRLTLVMQRANSKINIRFLVSLLRLSCVIIILLILLILTIPRYYLEIIKFIWLKYFAPKLILMHCSKNFLTF